MARIYRATYTTKGPDGQRVKKTARKWCIDYVDADGIRRRVAGFTDKRATEQRAAELERITDRRKVGLIDRYAEHRKRPLSEHVADWEKSMQDRGGTSEHASKSAANLLRVFGACSFQQWKDISASKVESYIAERRRDGLSTSTGNHYVQACKGFCAWMVRDRRAPENPLSHLRRRNTAADRRHDRRAFSTDELRQLVATVESGPVCYGILGHDRAALYRVAVETGLRAGELRSLAVGSFALSAEPPTVTVAAAYSKRRREDVLPIRLELANMLCAYFSERMPTAKAFRMPSMSNVARMLRRDLADVGIEYRDDAGRVLDFHAFRHTFITNLARGGVHPKVAQQLARHSTITLTMDRYSHTVMGDLSDALTNLPDLDHLPAEQTRQRATGTFDGAAGEATQPEPREGKPAETDREALRPQLGLLLGQTGYGECRSMSAADATETRCTDGDTTRKGNKHRGDDASCRDMSASVEIGSARTRTGNLEIMSPLLNSASAGDTETCDGASERLDLSLATILQDDPELASVVAAWPGLPLAVRAGIMAMVKATEGGA